MEDSYCSLKKTEGLILKEESYIGKIVPEAKNNLFECRCILTRIILTKWSTEIGDHFCPMFGAHKEVVQNVTVTEGSTQR